MVGAGVKQSRQLRASPRVFEGKGRNEPWRGEQERRHSLSGLETGKNLRTQFHLGICTRGPEKVSY